MIRPIIQINPGKIYYVDMFSMLQSEEETQFQWPNTVGTYKRIVTQSYYNSLDANVSITLRVNQVDTLLVCTINSMSTGPKDSGIININPLDLDLMSVKIDASLATTGYLAITNLQLVTT